MPHKVFVSSTRLDLESHRTSVIKAIRDAGLAVDPMEDWTAATDEPKDISQDRLTGCDLCVLLVAFRRGFVPDGEKLSITQLEYRAALRMSMDILVFLLDDDAVTAWPSQWNDLDSDPGIRTWREELSRRHTISRFGPDAATVRVAPALTRWLADRTQREANARQGPLADSAWLHAHADRLELQFARQMEGGASTAFDVAVGRYVDLLVKTKAEDGKADVELPFTELARRPAVRYLVAGNGGSGKTMALLKTAVDAARAACADSTVPVPLYARLASFDTTERGLDRLSALIGGPDLDPEVVLRALRDEGRPVLLLLDGFNEIATPFQSACLLALRELLQATRHAVLVTTRPDAAFGALKDADMGLTSATVVELADGDIKSFFDKRSLGGLYAQLDGPLRQLVRNPFMLWALSESCAGLASHELPRNQGELYRNFLDRYIFERREERKIPPPTRYNYKLVKRPLLSRLALEMSRSGTTRLSEDAATLKRVAGMLKSIVAEDDGVHELTPHVFMPERPGSQALIDETVSNGVLRRTGDSLEFMHQSVQDCFAAMALEQRPVTDILADRTPALRDALVLLAGLLPAADGLVVGLLESEPELAAACFGSSATVGAGPARSLVERISSFLRSPDPVTQRTGCQCVQAAHVETPELMEALRAIARSDSDARGYAVEAAGRFRQLDPIPILIDVLVGAPDFGVRQAVVDAVTKRTSGESDYQLSLGLGTLDIVESTLEEHHHAVRSGVLDKVGQLYSSAVTVDAAVAMVMSEPNPDGAVAYLRLLHRDAALAALRALVANGGETERAMALRYLPLVAGHAATMALFDVLDAPLDPLDAVLAGVGLASVGRQTYFGRTPFAPVLDALRKKLADPSCPALSRAGAAVALLHGTDDSDLERVLGVMRDTTEDVTFRETLLAGAFSVALIPVWLGAFWQMDERARLRRRRLVEAVVEQALTGDDRRVREAAVSSLQNEPDAVLAIVSKLADAHETEGVRAAACDAAATLKAAQALPILLELVTQPDTAQALRLPATMALSQLVDDETVATLEGLILASPEVVAVAVTSALALAGRHGALDRVAAMCITAPRFDDQVGRGIAALEWAAQVTDGALDRLMAVAFDAGRAMTGLAAAIRAHAAAPDKTVSRLAAAATDAARSLEVRERATLALAFLKSDAAARALEEMSRPDALPHVRATAKFSIAMADRIRADDGVSGNERLTMRLGCHMEAGSWEQALSDCSEIIAGAPGDAATYRWRSTCLLALHRVPEALDDVLKARELNPNDSETHRQVAQTYDEARQYDEAVAAARGAVQVNENDGYAWLDLGWYLYRADHLRESAEASRRGALLLPGEPGARFNVAVALLAQNDADAARIEYESALHVCGTLDEESARETLNSALSDLDALLKRRPELAMSAAPCLAMLGHPSQ